MPIAESRIQAQVRAILSQRDAPTRVWRNNVGGAELADGSWIKYGLGIGSADLIGMCKQLITPEMVGETFARFLSAEIKTSTGRLSKEQKLWADTVRSFGGIYVVLRSEREALDFLKNLE